MDFRFAQLMALYFNTHRLATTPAKSVADFMPDFLNDPATTKQSPEQQAAILDAWAAQMGAHVLPPGTTDEEVDALLRGPDWVPGDDDEEEG